MSLFALCDDSRVIFNNNMRYFQFDNILLLYFVKHSHLMIGVMLCIVGYFNSLDSSFIFMKQ